MSVHDLDYLLDKVRARYYHSSTMRRPTISWMDDYVTDYHGLYRFVENHIYISRSLDDKRVTEEMISMVIYHESLHQDFADHDDNFMAKMSLYPNHEKIDKKLLAFAEKAHEQMKHTDNSNSFTKGKKRVVYVNLPYAEDYMDAFCVRDGKVLVDFEAELSFSLTYNTEDVLLVMLAEFGGCHRIVGWCTDGELLSRPQFDEFSRFGDYDVRYQYVAEPCDVYVVPVTCCDYGISKDGLPKDFHKNKSFCFTIEDELIKPDLQYIESYCEGYWRIFHNEVDVIPKYEDISLRMLKELKISEGRSVWRANAIYDREPTVENLFLRAKCKKENWYLTASLEDYIKANKQGFTDITCVCEIIKLCVVLNRLNEAKDYYKKYQDKLPMDDVHLNNCIDYISNFRN